MIKVKEMKKLMERVEEFGEYELLIEDSVMHTQLTPKERELDLKLDHKENVVIVGLKK